MERTVKEFIENFCKYYDKPGFHNYKVKIDGADILCYGYKSDIDDINYGVVYIQSESKAVSDQITFFDD